MDRDGVQARWSQPGVPTSNTKPPSKPKCRPFTLLDAMILVAATAVGLWIGRSIGMDMRTEGWLGGWPDLEWPDSGALFSGWATYRAIHGFLTRLAFTSVPFLLPWTLALLGLRLRGPRPSLRRICRQPGFAACAAGAIVSAIGFLGHLTSSIERATWGDGFRPGLRIELIMFRDNYMTGDPDILFGWPVVAVWGVMALGRMLRAEVGWIDRTGRVIGWSWIVTLLLAVSRIQPD